MPSEEDAVNGDRLTFRREALLPALLALGVSPETTQMTLGQPPRTSGRDPRVVDAYVEMCAAQRTLYWDLAPAVLIDAALAHTRLGIELLDHAAHDDERARRLARAVAETSLLAARLAFFDLGQPSLAEQAFVVAEETVELSGDHALAPSPRTRMSGVAAARTRSSARPPAPRPLPGARSPTPVRRLGVAADRLCELELTPADPPDNPAQIPLSPLNTVGLRFRSAERPYRK